MLWDCWKTTSAVYEFTAKETSIYEVDVGIEVRASFRFYALVNFIIRKGRVREMGEQVTQRFLDVSRNEGSLGKSVMRQI